MAARIEVNKMSKTERKLGKKIARIKDQLSKTENVTVCESPTKILCVQNGGLINGVSEADILSVFHQYGNIQDVIMIPEKPYCFVCFDSENSAAAAKEGLTGSMLREGKDPSQNITLYIFFVSHAPSNICPSTELPPGLKLEPNFLSEDTEKELLQAVNFEENSSSGSTLKHRQVKHFGYEFKYGINNVDPKCPLEEGFPEICHSILQKALALNLIAFMPDQLTVNRYLPGQGIPPHVDTPSAFEDGIISLSCGSQVVMDFRHPDGRHLSVLLPPRSLLVMTGESRFVWSHSITPRKSDIIPSERGSLTLSYRGVRTSFTFRKLSSSAGVIPKDEKDKIGCMPSCDKEAAILENQHVYKVYEEIASHFSDTRHKPWPKIAEFLKAQELGSILVDTGCGNGKYFGINRQLVEIGSDRSENLASICHDRGHQVFVSDILAIPVRSDAVDVGLCIAVIHHLSTHSRRRRAVEELVRILKPGGSTLIYVWAQEQEMDKQKSKYLKPWKQGRQNNKAGEGDLLLHPGDQVTQEKIQADTQEKIQADSDVLSRLDSHIKLEPSIEHHTNCRNSDKIYHGDQVAGSSGETLQVHVNRTEFKQQDMLVPWKLKRQPNGEKEVGGANEAATFHRYYHIFKQGELEALCNEVPNCTVRCSYYDQGNWGVVLQKTYY